MNNKSLSGQIAALLLGGAVGDALGVPVEFMKRGSFTVSGMQGFGAHGQPPGTWSDDTSLTLCLAGSLSRGFNLDDIARNFVAWHDEAAFTARGSVFDIGISTAKAVRNFKAGAAPEASGCQGADENGNGALMRIAPLVFYIAHKPDAARFAVTKAVSSITHAHELSVAACFIYLEYLRELLCGAGKLGAYAVLRARFRDTSPYIGGEALGKFARILRGDIRALPEASIKSGGFVLHTLEAALWCFLNTDSYRDAVLRAVNLGDDTDTTAAVTGSMAGLYYGLAEIPDEWRSPLARSNDFHAVAQALTRGLSD
jgi:ADP-ribosylglycohydrolase